MQSDFIKETCLALQQKIDMGLIDIEDLYVPFVKNMNTFTQRLEDFSAKHCIYYK